MMSLFVCTILELLLYSLYDRGGQKSKREVKKKSGKEVLGHPEMTFHIHMAVGLEGDALLL